MITCHLDQRELGGEWEGKRMFFTYKNKHPYFLKAKPNSPQLVEGRK